MYVLDYDEFMSSSSLVRLKPCEDPLPEMEVSVFLRSHICPIPGQVIPLIVPGEGTDVSSDDPLYVAIVHGFGPNFGFDHSGGLGEVIAKTHRYSGQLFEHTLLVVRIKCLFTFKDVGDFYRGDQLTVRRNFTFSERKHRIKTFLNPESGIDEVVSSLCAQLAKGSLCHAGCDDRDFPRALEFYSDICGFHPSRIISQFDSAALIEQCRQLSLELFPVLKEVEFPRNPTSRELLYFLLSNIPLHTGDIFLVLYKNKDPIFQIRSLKLALEGIKTDCKDQQSPAIMCSKCGFKVTTADKMFPFKVNPSDDNENRAMFMDDQPLATYMPNTLIPIFSNPHGNPFECVLFDCPAEVILGYEDMLEFSWFPGYKWSTARCKECNVHMGFVFRVMDALLSNVIEFEDRNQFICFDRFAISALSLEQQQSLL